MTVLMLSKERGHNCYSADHKDGELNETIYSNVDKEGTKQMV